MTELDLSQVKEVIRDYVAGKDTKHNCLRAITQCHGDYQEEMFAYLGGLLLDNAIGIDEE